MRIKGATAIGTLVLAVTAGAAGGAIALSQTGHAPATAPISVHQVDDVAPSVPAATVVDTPAPAETGAPVAEDPAPVSSPAPVVHRYHKPAVAAPVDVPAPAPAPAPVTAQPTGAESSTSGTAPVDHMAHGTHQN